MELELGLKITKLRDDDPSSTDFRINKDRAGPLFLTTETDSMFILTAHLKGFRRERIKIDISEDGKRIGIRGEKSVQEMVMMGWTMYKKEVEIQAFERVFWIPDGVVLDRIKAKFKQEEEGEAVLKIYMPKSVKGIRGTKIEDVRAEEACGSETKQIVEEEESFEREKMRPILEEHESKESGIEESKEVNQVVESMPQASEIGHGIELEDIIPEKETPAPATTTTYEETEITNQEEKIPEAESEEHEEGSEGQEHKLKTVESTKNVELQEIQQEKIPNPPSSQQDQVEEENTNTEGQIHQVEAAKMQEHDSVNIQEQMEAKPDQELEKVRTLPPDHPAEKETKDEEVHEHEEESQIQEEKTDRVQELHEEKEADSHESSQTEKREDLSDPETETKKPASKRSTLCAPCFYAGSAILVSLIVFVVHLVRTKKNKK